MYVVESLRRLSKYYDVLASAYSVGFTLVSDLLDLWIRLMKEAVLQACATLAVGL